MREREKGRAEEARRDGLISPKEKVDGEPERGGEGAGYERERGRKNAG